MTTITSSKVRGTDSTDRTPVLPSTRTAPVQQRRPFSARFGGTAKRLLSTLMRSLASPHV
jgi:hypothetical protein